ARADGPPPTMTRFNITLQEGVDFVLHAVMNALGSEVFVPKIPSYKITDLAEAVAPGCEQEEIGIRPGEKIHEEMITEADSYTSLDVGDYYVILPQNSERIMNEYLNGIGAEKVNPGFRYNSGENNKWLGVEELKGMVEKEVKGW
ncbi:MAG: polysaccharide biosynthesis protein, partial [Flavobacteriales bacterium]